MPLVAGLVQLHASDDPAANLPETLALIREAADRGAELILTPEVTNCVSASRTRQREVLTTEAEDRTVAAFREAASGLGRWILAGSLALKAEGPDERFVNRSFLIDANGEIRARYDKIHMFDVEIDGEDSYRESSSYRAGRRAVTAESPWGRIGLTICYDLRFPALYRALAENGAGILTVPSAFTVPTGRAHWHVLLRARAIETGCFVLAPAQWGKHAATRGRVRETYGHSLAVDPWGEVLADAPDGANVTLVELDLDRIKEVRSRIPSLANARAFEGP